MERSDAEWREILTSQEYEVLREKGTEKPFSGEYWDNKKHGIYRCSGCGQEVFRSKDKFESGTGWPSFMRPSKLQNVAYEADHHLTYTRTEVHCKNCGGHLGHLFDDGPAPTGKRYCINSCALKFEEKK